MLMGFPLILKCFKYKPISSTFSLPKFSTMKIFFFLFLINTLFVLILVLEDLKILELLVIVSFSNLGKPLLLR